ncbi:hypothetical protein [Chitinophaga pinensis]|uniref:Uncharacterized protein n=1 Tax=Chitinophaga pinensis TaxID=79329 RepID=A0A5C6M1S7_9BACT|nr:hypothetical protein [Chitinophaga pinensis]TWW01899.1 hypothetical protein FEF09_04870 [Chitinophaga pinensis]
MKYILTVSLLLVQFLAAKAQYPTDNDLPAKSEKVKKIKLSSQAADISAPAVPIAGITVIPACGDTLRLGFVQVGMANKRISAVPNKPWNAYLQDFADTRFKPALTASGAQLLWVVEDLRINERTFAMSEKAYVRLKANAYLSKDNAHYQHISTLDTVLLRGGMDVTSKHDENIAEVFGLLWNKSIDAANTATENATLTVTDIVSKEQNRFALPILQTTTYKPGVYKTYQEFLENKPSIEKFNVEVKRRDVIIQEVGTNDNIGPVVENPWGICKDGELYIYYKERLIPIEKSGNSFVISNYLEASNRRNQSLFWGGLIGGVGGAALGLTTSGLFNVETIPYITRQQPEATTLDIDNGTLMF